MSHKIQWGSRAEVDWVGVSNILYEQMEEKLISRECITFFICILI